MSLSRSTIAALLLTALFAAAPAGAQQVKVIRNADITRIALLGCIRQEEPAPALQSYAEAQPDLSLWVGDNIYVDTQDDPQAIFEGYQRLAAQPGFAALRATGYHLATWDDHDYGDNDENRHYVLKDAGRAAFTGFWGEAGVPADPQDGVYSARLFETHGKRLHVIMLDVRWNRDEPGTGRDILGERQWQWLAGQLVVEADLTLIVSGSQILLPEETGSETWDNYAGATERLFNLVRRSAKQGVVFITGDQHYAEVARSRGALDYDAIELQFSGVNQIEAPERNPYRVSPVNRSRNSMALIDIQWEDDEHNLAHLLYRVVDTDTGEVESLYRVNFGELGFELPMTQRQTFAREHTITLESRHPELAIRYTLDGFSPSIASPLYNGPFTINRDARVTAAYFTEEGFKRSGDFSRDYARAVPVRALGSGGTQQGLAWSYWEGDFGAVPDFGALGEAMAKGTSEALDIKAIERRADHYAIRFTGFLEVPETGLYRISTRSDDGSLLAIGDTRVVENDGSHSPRLRSGFVALEAGHHPLTIGYFEDHGGALLDLIVERFTDNGEARPVTFALTH
jgi:alkaline phosphatase D